MNAIELTKFALEKKASDIHLSSGQPPSLRISGDLIALNAEPLSAEAVIRFLSEIMSEEQIRIFQEKKDLDFAIDIAGNRFRVNVFFVLNGPACVMRHIPQEILTLEQLRIPQSIRHLVNLTQGLVLITGVTGSGKSTTLAALINHINENEHKHILTIEDPIEFVHKSKKSLVNQREVGKHSESFAAALKGSLREDLDVVLVGEMRDYETIKLALTIAETGHLVFATLHSSSAAQTLDRLVGVFPGNEKEMIMKMLSGSLEAVVAQKLLKKKDGSGVVAAHEVMISNSGVRNLIREGKISQLDSMLQIGSKYGMCTMKDSVDALVKAGIVDAKVAQNALNNLYEENKNSGNTTF